MGPGRSNELQPVLLLPTLAQVVLLAENGHLSTWSPTGAHPKPMHKVQLDMSSREDAITAPTSVGPAAPQPPVQNWATDFCYLPALGRVRCQEHGGIEK